MKTVRYTTVKYYNIDLYFVSCSFGVKLFIRQSRLSHLYLDLYLINYHTQQFSYLFHVILGSMQGSCTFLGEGQITINKAIKIQL